MYTTKEQMILVNVEDLSNTQIDWLVAKLTHSTEYGQSAHTKYTIIKDGDYFFPSTNWGHGGPLIEQYNISLIEDYGKYKSYMSSGLTKGILCYGKTPLVAAMKCFIQAKLGTGVNVPNYLP